MDSQARSRAELHDTDLFRHLVEHSLGLMCVHDLDGNLLYVNAAAALALGFRPEDGIGWNLRRFLAPSVVHEFDAYLERLRENAADSGLMRVVAKDGEERVWLYRNVLHQEPGKPPRVLGHAQDVTERIRAEGALKESEERFRLLADTAPVLIWMSDPDGSCVFLNRPWLDFTGRTPDEQRGEGWIESVHPDDRDRVVQAYRAAVLARGPFRAEYRLRRADGEYRWVLGNGVARSGAGRAFAGLVGSCVDVTEIRQAREVLERARDELSALVARRTEELERSNARLRAEIQQRVRIEEEMARARRIGDGEAQAGTSARKPDSAGSAPTVLLVERRADVRQLLRHMLQLDGYRVVAAADEDDALTIVSQSAEPVHLVVMNAPVPGAGGRRVADQLAIAHPDVRMLYLCDSAEDVPASRRAGELAPVLLMKPFTMATLLVRVREALAWGRA